MRRSDKLKTVEVTYFLVPFLILLIGFSVLTGLTVKNRVEEKYALLEERTIEIANSYSHNLAHTAEAYDRITALLDNKIRIVAQALMRIEDKDDSEVLKDIAKTFAVDEIYVYSSEGKVVSSTYDQVLGWEVYEGHPVHDFMVSNQTVRIEKIRQDTENGLYYKFGYMKDEAGGFVQLGILAENIQDFLEDFEIAKLIEEISQRDEVKNVFFVNTKFEVVASSLDNYTGTTIEEEALQQKLMSERTYAERTEVGGKEILRVAVPIYSDFMRIGTLVIDWPTDNLDAQVLEIIRFGAIVLAVIVLTTGSILYYAYRKNQANIKIAYYDQLTGLRNNKYLHDYLDHIVAVPRRRNKAVLLLHVKNLKTVNMTYGFEYGDAFLKQVADKIRQELKTDDNFFRFDGNQFVVVSDSVEGQEELRKLAERLICIFDEPVAEGTDLQYVDIQIAIVEIQARHTSTDKILQDALLTFPHIEDNAAHPIVFFDERMEKSLQREDKIMKVLRDVIGGKDETSFYLEYQPKLDLNKSWIIGFEALARLRIDQLGQIPPDEFIALAEKKLLINELGNHILRLAADFIGRMQGQGIEDITVAVNISGIQLLREGFVEYLQRAPYLSERILQAMEFEITESVLLEHYEQINETLEQIKRMGIAVSLDDFGTGFSSLSTIGELHIDTVKIDRFFISRISRLPDQDLITSDIISMAHKIGLLVVAEGVEDERQEAYLRKHGCDIIQGYLISRPLAEQDAVAFLRDCNDSEREQ